MKIFELPIARNIHRDGMASDVGSEVSEESMFCVFCSKPADVMGQFFDNCST